MEINEICMREHKKKYHKKPIIIEKNIHDPNSQQIIVYPNLPIISKHNNKKLDIVNNEQFVVSKLKDNGQFIIIKNDERELKLSQDDFKNLFYPAYCVTCHSAQGQTYNFAYTIHEWEKLTTKLKYVALSRSTCLEHVNII